MPQSFGSRSGDPDDDIDADDLLDHDDDPRRDDEGDQTGGVIPYKNPQALIAYYCGLFALFPILGFFLGVAGFILGIRGLQEAQRRPKIRGQVHAWIGIVCGGLCALMWGTCGIVIVYGLLNQP